MSARTGLGDYVRRAWNSPWGGAARVLFGVSTLAYVLLHLEKRTLLQLVARATLPEVVLVAAVALVAHAVGALRFKLLCDPVVRLPFLLHLRQYFVGAFATLFMPSSLGGDVARIVLLKNAGAPALAGTSLVLGERALGVLSLLVVSSSLAGFAPIPSPVRFGIFGATLLAFLGAALAMLVARRYRGRTGLFAIPLVAAEAVGVALRRPAAAVAFLAYQALTVCASVIVGLALSLPIPASTIFVLTPLVWFVTMLPLSVGGVGLREAGFVLVFGWANVRAEHAVALSLGTYASMVVIGLVGGAWLVATTRSTASY